MHNDLIVLLGPTASGKTRLGVALARELKGEIISADSRQVYRGLNLGAGKDLAEYGDVAYHLIDIVDPGYEFNVFEYQKLFYDCFNDINRRGMVPLLVGGTGLYIEAVLSGYRMTPVPENQALREELAALSVERLADRLKNLSQRLHNTTDLLDRNRLTRAIEIEEFTLNHKPDPPREIRPLVFGIRLDRKVLRHRVTERLKERLCAGLIDEVKGLLEAGVSHDTLEFLGLEYRFVSRHLRGELTRNDMFQKLNGAIHEFAKKQETWFRRMERNGTRIHWLNGEENMLHQALDILQDSVRVHPE